jgi:hypothetical protein
MQNVLGTHVEVERLPDKLKCSLFFHAISFDNLIGINASDSECTFFLVEEASCAGVIRDKEEEQKTQTRGNDTCFVYGFVEFYTELGKVLYLQPGKSCAMI